ncbi:hypothetical protein HAX54_016077 [Datura stramonium]|uniref:Uncharacterized protein n=1 Tax=Datura stramonium TaxID=4076 RepID=A0ABS8UKK6_DATST|nr:hypothetical protein [Datura stramonium]
MCASATTSIWTCRALGSTALGKGRVQNFQFLLKASLKPLHWSKVTRAMQGVYELIRKIRKILPEHLKLILQSLKICFRWLQLLMELAKVEVDVVPKSTNQKKCNWLKSNLQLLLFNGGLHNLAHSLSFPSSSTLPGTRKPNLILLSNTSPNDIPYFPS